MREDSDNISIDDVNITIKKFGTMNSYKLITTAGDNFVRAIMKLIQMFFDR